ncbi:unnamed protein product [Debaryomyces tyrocola]|nr:unnamed protein product [Debaryomyces tyrocola]
MKKNRREFSNEIYLLCTRCVCYDSTSNFSCNIRFSNVLSELLVYILNFSLSRAFPRHAAIVLITVKQSRLNQHKGRGMTTPRSVLQIMTSPELILYTLSHL